MPWSKDLVDVRYLNLINFASQLKAGKGLTMVVSFLRGNAGQEDDIKTAQQVKIFFFDINFLQVKFFQFVFKKT